MKREDPAGRMDEQMYAVAVKMVDDLKFRAPEARDLGAIDAASEEFVRRSIGWEATGRIPNEEIPYGHRSHERDGIVRYGIERMCDFFTNRQLLSLGTLAELLDEMKPMIRAELGEDKAAAVITYLALMLDKAADYDSRFMRWEDRKSTRLNSSHT